MTLEQSVELVLSALKEAGGGEIFIPKIPSMKITDLAKLIAPECEIEYIGIRPGEKLHESMISEDESRQSIELEDRYAILPAHSWWNMENLEHGKKLPDGFSYSSDTNDHWLNEEEMLDMIENGS